MTFELRCHRLGDYTVPLAPARPDRAIFDDNKHAYRCLPLATANAAGWEMLCPTGVTIEWDGGANLDAITITPDDPDDRRYVISNFSRGIVTFETGWLFRTTPGHALWAMGSPNDPKDGIAPLAGVIETDWLPYPFTMNWQMTRPGKVRFEAGEPFCFITPLQIGALQACQPVELDIADAPDIQADLAAWTHDRRAFLERLNAGDPDATRTPWRRIYFKGDQAPGAVSQKPDQHINKLRMKAPVRIPSEPAPASTFHLDGVLPTTKPPREIRNPAEAAALGFLMVEDFMAPDLCADLVNFYRTSSHLLGKADADPYWNDRILQFSEAQKADPARTDQMRRALARALGLIADFYKVRSPVYADVLQLVGWREGMFMPVHADNAHPRGEPHPTPHRDYSGLVYLNDDYVGGGLFLPHQNVVIRPKTGMFLSLPGGPSHRHGVERITTGDRFTMPFFVTRNRAKAARHLHPETSMPPAPLSFTGLGSELSFHASVEA